MARELVDNNVTGRVSQGLLYIEYFIFPQTFKMFDGSEFWQKQKNSLKTETVYQPFWCYDHEIVIFSLRASKMWGSSSVLQSCTGPRVVWTLPSWQRTNAA